MNIDNQLITADSAKRWIEMLQKQLIRENPSALPNDGIDGIYGAETKEWVTRFQRRKGLYIDGIAGTETLERLRTDIVFYVGGPSGRGVELLQEDLEYFYLSSGIIDGIYGSGTRQSVRDFQSDNSLFVDGEAGPGTLKKMDELLTTLFTQSGDTGSLVRRIQEQLNEQESLNISVYVDGIYGSETKNAIMQFQESNDLYVDGIAGPVTMNLLNIEAIHPLLREELIEFSQYQGEEPQLLEESVQKEYITALQSNNVFLSTLPSGSTSSIEANALLDKGVYDFGEEVVIIVGFYTESLNSFISYMDVSTQKLVAHFVFETTGERFEDRVKMTVYNLEGTTVESVDQTWADFSYNSLNSAIDLTSRVLEAQSQSSFRVASSSDELIEDLSCIVKSEGVCLFLGALGTAPPAMLAIYGACSATASVYTTLHGCGLPD
ncbi:peptidoglycan-binding protein (plasmid) [Planococcus maritimus]|nr:peptidoglycan-binding protein [Planococcus sp. SK3692]MDE4086892.1 peptidoglycan-binding protein [Planococcus maritimus]